MEKKDGQIINFEHYSQYYDLELLLNKLKYNNIYIDNIIDIYELFKYSVIYGIEDLAEYLYIFHEIKYEINELLEWVNSPILVSNNLNSNEDKSDCCLSGIMSGSSGLKISIVDEKAKNGHSVLSRLTKLRKYSSYVSKNKKFYYQINTSKIGQITFNK
jgi:hypothetical protein